LNEAPTFNGATRYVNENSAMGDKVGFLLVDTGTDPDAGFTLTYKLIEPRDDEDKFAINENTGQVYVDRNGAWVSSTEKPLDYETQKIYNLTVQVTDQHGLKNAGTLTIELKDVNEPASMESQSRSILENSPEGGLIGAPIQSVDEDVGIYAVPTYTISKLEGCRGTSCFVIGNPLFRIEPTTGQLSVLRSYEEDGTFSLNYEHMRQHGFCSTLPCVHYRLTVRSTDAGGEWGEAFVTINLLDVNELPIFHPADGSDSQQLSPPFLAQSSTIKYVAEDGTESVVYGAALDENSIVNTVIGTIAVDAVDQGDSVTYAIIAGNDAGMFKLSIEDILDDRAADGTIRVATISVAKNMIDHELDSEHLLVIEVTDSLGEQVSSEFRIVINDIAENPKFITDFTGAVLENAATGTFIGQPASATDQDAVVSTAPVELWRSVDAIKNSTCIMQVGKEPFNRAA
jgi:hypothetical protein